MKQNDLLAPSEPLDRMGQNLARMLSQSCGDMPHDLTERLRVARQQALAVRKPEPAPRLQLAAQGTSLTLGGPSSEGLGLWSILGSALPLVALLALGLLGASRLTLRALDAAQQTPKVMDAAMAEADKAAVFADESPDPTVADITKHIYWEEDNRGPNTTSRGTIIFE